MRHWFMVMIAVSAALWECGEGGTTIVGETEGAKSAAHLVAEDHTSGNDGSEEPPSRVVCRRKGTSDFPVPAGQTAKGVYACVAEFSNGLTEDCEVDAGRGEVGCVPRRLVVH
jgi:hypothetical protein